MNLFFKLVFILITTISISYASSETESCTIVIFGATGDLTARKLIPALYNLTHEENISKNTTIIGFARRDYTHETFRNTIRETVDQFTKLPSSKNNSWKQFENHIYYNQANFDDDTGYENLQKLLLKIDQEKGTINGNRIYYLATHPSHFSTIIKKLHENKLIYKSKSNENWSRVIIEKPFGNDLNSAVQLQNNISKYLDESQIYRMDHYLGKEGVLNLLALRFKSGFFEPLWNSKHIDNVQITLSEDIGIGSRANFWEETGSLRDVFQNHLMQLLSIVAMDRPSQLNSYNIHEEKIKVLNAIRPFTSTELTQSVISGQYRSGMIKGINVPGYKQEAGVSDNSLSETFLATKIFIDNERWSGVPFYIRGGKRLFKQTTEIAIVFKDQPSSSDNPNPLSNIMFIRIQPNAGIFLKTLSKVPKLDTQVKPIVFGYSPETYFKKSASEAYEKLLYDCINGDSALYVKFEEQLATWRLLTPILNHWKFEDSKKILEYDAGSWGPEAANELPLKDGRFWKLLEI